MEEYLLPYGKMGTATLKENGHEYHAQVCRVEELPRADNLFDSAKGDCWACIIHDGPITCGPGGEALLNWLRGTGVENVFCRVTGSVFPIPDDTACRAAAMALEKAGIAVMRCWCRLFCAFTYEEYEDLSRRIAGLDAFETETTFDQYVYAYLLIDPEDIRTYFSRISDEPVPDDQPIVTQMQWAAVPLSRLKRKLPRKNANNV